MATAGRKHTCKEIRAAFPRYELQLFYGMSEFFATMQLLRELESSVRAVVRKDAVRRLSLSMYG